MNFLISRGCAADVSDQGLYAYEYILSDPKGLGTPRVLGLKEDEIFGGGLEHSFKPWYLLVQADDYKSQMFREEVHAGDRCCSCSHATKWFHVFRWGLDNDVIPSTCQAVYAQHVHEINGYLNGGFRSFINACDDTRI